MELRYSQHYSLKHKEQCKDGPPPSPASPASPLNHYHCHAAMQHQMSRYCSQSSGKSDRHCCSSHSLIREVSTPATRRGTRQLPRLSSPIPPRMEHATFTALQPSTWRRRPALYFHPANFHTFTPVAGTSPPSAPTITSPSTSGAACASNP